ncbi:unnamed protein product, partial [Ectocarpus sp. 13 AM-2016]
GAGSRRSYAPPRHGRGDAVLHAARFHRRYGLRGRGAAPPPRSRSGGSAAAPGPAPSTGAAAATHADAVEPGLRDARGLRAGGLRLVQPGRTIRRSWHGRPLCRRSGGCSPSRSLHAGGAYPRCCWCSRCNAGVCGALPAAMARWRGGGPRWQRGGDTPTATATFHAAETASSTTGVLC